MNITIISDTHGLHEELSLKKGDLLIHAGDITEYGTKEETSDFLNWFTVQPFTHKIFIAGNHDLFFEGSSKAIIKKLIPKNIIYLQNAGVEINGLKIWGSPVTPYFLGMAFNGKAAIKKVWNKIPDNTDIIITHGPPKTIMDAGIGCIELLNRINKIKPLLHCFGHAHGVSGCETIGNVNFINAALANTLDPFNNEPYKIIGTPIIFEI